MRKKFKKRILIFSFCVSFSSLIIGVIIFSIYKILLPYQRMGKSNSLAFQTIYCDEGVCEISNFLNRAYDMRPPDYVVKKDDGFFIWAMSDFTYFWLNYSDPSFRDIFRTPTSYISPIQEKWRLYSKNKKIGNFDIEIMVGWFEASKRLIANPIEVDYSYIDNTLIDLAEKIASQLSIKGNSILRPNVVVPGDIAYQIVDASTGAVIEWKNGIPAFLPYSQMENLEKKKFGFHKKSNLDLFLFRTDVGEKFFATSLEYIGNLKIIVLQLLSIFIFMFLIGYGTGLTIFKRYFIFAHCKPLSIAEALKCGEGQEIEFKRGIVDEDFLKSVTAFANTNDGTIFVGIDDEGKIKGIEAKTLKAKDVFRTKILNLIKNRIKPYPLVNISFEEIRGYTIAKVFVPRGEELLYFLDGIIYIRDGGSDVKAQPERVKKIISEVIL